MTATALASRPADLLEPLDRRFLVREHLGERHQTDALAVEFAGCRPCDYSSPSFDSLHIIERVISN